MTDEIIDAIRNTYGDYSEIEAECYVFLAHIHTNNNEAISLASKASSELEKMDRCPECGDKLVEHFYTESHSELEGNPVERVCVKVCPQCDMKDWFCD